MKVTLRRAFQKCQFPFPGQQDACVIEETEGSDRLAVVVLTYGWNFSYLLLGVYRCYFKLDPEIEILGFADWRTDGLPGDGAQDWRLWQSASRPDN